MFFLGFRVSGANAPNKPAYTQILRKTSKNRGLGLPKLSRNSPKWSPEWSKTHKNWPRAIKNAARNAENNKNRVKSEEVRPT